MNRNKFNEDQIRLKLLTKQVNGLYKKSNLNINLYKLPNITDNLILESLLLLEFFTGTKTHINHLKRNFKEVNIQVANNLNKKNLSYFFNLLKIFYLPILQRRNLQVTDDKIFSSNFNYTITNINLIPFIPDIYFKWNTPINCFFTFNYINKNEIKLILSYMGFFFTK